MFAGMHDASALVAGATLAAARKVWAGEAWHGASIAGGLHHAMRASASGFCAYNDPAIAISWLLAAGASRVAYVDIDVHHGDGVQAAFHEDPRVLTISVHEHPATLWPGTGWPSETGGPGAPGSAVNVALPAGTGTAAGCVPSTPWCEPTAARIRQGDCANSALTRPTESITLRHSRHGTRHLAAVGQSLTASCMHAASDVFHLAAVGQSLTASCMHAASDVFHLAAVGQSLTASCMHAASMSS